MIPGLNAQTISPFPNPPDYAQQYTNERIAQGSAPSPPAPQTEFRVFGEEYRLDDEVIPPLSSSGIRVLYTNKNDWKAEMKKLNRSVCAAFLDLIEILIRCPDHPTRDEKMNDIHTIFINMHHLINEYRPVQARDTLRLLQKQQLDQLKDTVARLKSFIQDGKNLLIEEFEKVNVTLPAPPKPSPETKILVQEGDVIFDVEEKNEGKNGKKKNLFENIQRVDARPTIEHLKMKQILDLANMAAD